MKTFFKKSLCVSLLPIIALSACRQDGAINEGSKSQTTTAVQASGTLPSINHAFSCLPESAAFIAAHRGYYRESFTMHLPLKH